MNKYGLPYQGSKSRIAELVLSYMPRGGVFMDLFAGGCSVSHCAMLSGRYSRVHVNDINPMMPRAFSMALSGGFSGEDRWISREDFFRLRDTDPYAAICFSFGCDLHSYAYSREKEPYKRALHHALMFGDYTLSDRLIGIDLRPIGIHGSVSGRYRALRRILTSCSDRRVEHLEKYGRIYELENVESVSRLQGALHPAAVTYSSCDYSEVEIPSDAVVYCDIPYIGTKRYKGRTFDYPRFYDWCSRQSAPVFISSYTMPSEQFAAIASIPFTCNMCATRTNRTTESIFVPRHQYAEYSMPLL